REKCSATDVTGDGSLGLQLGERLAHGIARHAEALGELALGGQPRPRVERALRGAGQDEFTDALRAFARACSGHEAGHFAFPLSGAMPVRHPGGESAKINQSAKLVQIMLTLGLSLPSM